MNAQTSAGYDSFANALMESGDPYAMAAGAAAKALKGVVQSLHIGTGRQEADRIVVWQNQLTQLLVTANSAMGQASTSAEHLVRLRSVIAEANDEFLTFIQDRQQFPDGRASSQAYQTMFGSPGYARVTLENLDKEIALRGGILGQVQAAAGSNPMLVAAAAGVGLLLLLRK